MHSRFADLASCQTEFAECPAGTTGQFTAVTLTARTCVMGHRLNCAACFHALFHLAGSIVNDRFESGAFSSKLLSAGFALEFTID